MMKVYKEIRRELELYDKGMLGKDEIIILTKTDTIDNPKIIDKAVKEFMKLPARPREASGAGGKKPVFVLSLYDDKSIKAFSDALVKLLRSKNK